jgi:hypothetical protein
MGNGETAKHFGIGAAKRCACRRAFGCRGRVRRLGRGVLLETMERSVEDVRAIFAEIDRLGGTSFLPNGGPEQPIRAGKVGSIARKGPAPAARGAQACPGPKGLRQSWSGASHSLDIMRKPGAENFSICSGTDLRIRPG